MSTPSIPNSPRSRPDNPQSAANEPTGWRAASARIRLGVSAFVAVLVGMVTALLWSWQYGLLLGWIAGSLVFDAWMLLSILPMDPAHTKAHAAGDNPGRKATEVTMVIAALASLGAVAILLGGGSNNKVVDAALAILAVALSWGTVHTVFTTRYARLYYTAADGGSGIDFNQDDPPQYSDFAYLGFTIGMTFQVSDTDLKTKAIRATALRHALLSYLFGAIIIATTINLVSGLSK